MSVDVRRLPSGLAFFMEGEGPPVVPVARHVLSSLATIAAPAADKELTR